MNKNEIFQKLTELLRENYGKNDFELSMKLGVGDPGLDLNSMEIVQLIVIVEETFDVFFDFDKLFYTIDDIVEEIYNIKCPI